MRKLYFLGTGYAVPEEGHDNTHLFLDLEERGILVDCGTNPLPTLKRAGIALDQITDLLITHFHPDHASGMPMLLMSLWLLGRKKPLNIYGLGHVIERARQLMDMFDWKTWPNFYPTRFHTLPEKAGHVAFEDEGFRVLTSPMKHLIPSIGLRVEMKQDGRVIAYTSDTEPCPAAVALANSADVLIHESAGPSIGHSSPAQAGACAQQAGAKRLYLIHTAPDPARHAEMLAQAKAAFGGEVSVAADGMVLDF